MEPAANSKNPPVIELVLSVQFEPIKFSSGIFAEIWKSAFSNFQFVEDAIAVEDHFENFERNEPKPSVFKLMAVDSVVPRFVLSNPEGDRLIQFQSTRFFCNWRKKEGLEYPDYEEFSGWFIEQFSLWNNALRNQHMRAIPNQFELTYVDAFIQGDLWNKLSEWQHVLPGLFLNIGTNGIGMTMSNRAANWSFDLPNRFGRLHVSAKYGLPKLAMLQGKSALILNTTVRGPLSENDDCLRVFGNAHETAVNFFRSVISEKVGERCP